MAAKNKRKFSILPWFLLLIVGCGWFLDAATRPRAEPFMTRLGCWMIEQSVPTAEGDDKLLAIGKYLISLRRIITNVTSGDATATATPTPAPGSATEPAAAASRLLGRWKLISAKALGGDSLRENPDAVCHIEFRENGTAELLTVTPDGRYSTDTLYWDITDGQLRVDDMFLFLGGAVHCDYAVEGYTLTIRCQTTSDSAGQNLVAVFYRAQ